MKVNRVVSQLEQHLCYDHDVWSTIIWLRKQSSCSSTEPVPCFILVCTTYPVKRDAMLSWWESWAWFHQTSWWPNHHQKITLFSVWCVTYSMQRSANQVKVWSFADRHHENDLSFGHENQPHSKSVAQPMFDHSLMIVACETCCLSWKSTELWVSWTNTCVMTLMFDQRSSDIANKTHVHQPSQSLAWS